jgi:hypothetical protein
MPIAAAKQLDVNYASGAINAGGRSRFRCLQAIGTVRLFWGVRGFSGISTDNRFFKYGTGVIFAPGKIATAVRAKSLLS